MAKRVSKRALAALLVLITAAVFAIFPLSAARAETAQMCGEHLIVIDDLDNCLTEIQELELMNNLTSAARSADCNIGIVITSDLNGLSDKEYADGFSDYHFGAGSDSVVLLLLNSYNNPEHASHTDRISTSGKMINKLDGYYDKIFDAIYKEMGDFKGDPFAFNEETGTYGGYDYYAACEAFAESIVVYAGKVEIDNDVDPGFSGGVEGTKARLFAEALAEFFAGILRMLGGLRVGC